MATSWTEDLWNAIGPNEAQAGAFDDLFGKKAVKATATKVAKHLGQSSAAERLAGMELQGKTITDVRKGAQDWRYLIFDDGTQQAVQKRVVHELARERGTQVYLGKLKEMQEGLAETDEQLKQAIKSLIYRRQRQSPIDTKRIKSIYDREHRQIVKEAGFETPSKYVWVESEKMFMPEDYAKILDENNIVKIKLRKPNEPK